MFREISEVAHTSQGCHIAIFRWQNGFFSNVEELDYLCFCFVLHLILFKDASIQTRIYGHLWVMPSFILVDFPLKSPSFSICHLRSF